MRVDVITFLLYPALLVENQDNVVHWVQFFCTVPVEHTGLLSYLHSNSLWGAHPCKELSMNRQQGNGPTISSVGTRLEMTRGVKLLLHLDISFLRVAVLDKPVDSQHQHREPAWGMAYPCGCTTRLTLLQWLVVWSWVSNLTSLSLFLHF